MVDLQTTWLSNNEETPVVVPSICQTNPDPGGRGLQDCMSGYGCMQWIDGVECAGIDVF